MGDPWGIGGFRSRGKPNIKQIVKNNRSKKSQKSAKSEKNRKNLILFFTENGLKCIRKSTIGQKKHKIGEIGKKIVFFFFLLKMVSNALGTPRNTFKSQKLAKKKKNHKNGKNRIRLV